MNRTMSPEQEQPEHGSEVDEAGGERYDSVASETEKEAGEYVAMNEFEEKIASDGEKPEEPKLEEETSNDVGESEEDPGEREVAVTAQLKNRLFDTSKYANFTATNSTVCHQSPTGPWYEITSPEQCACCGQKKGIPGSIVIGIDGSYQHQSENTPATCAVYFHPANKFNDSWMFADKTNTSHRAELTAALMALRIAHQIRKRNPNLTESESLACGNVGPETRLRQVLIKTDSEGLVDAMMLGMYTSANKPWKDADLLKSIDDEVEALNGQGVRVQFLHVPRVENAMADYLAKSRLKGTKAKPAMDLWLLNNRWWSAISNAL